MDKLVQAKDDVSWLIDINPLVDYQNCQLEIIIEHYKVGIVGSYSPFS